MSENAIRAAAGLAVALSLAAFSWPAPDDDGSDTTSSVRAAAVSGPIIAGSVDELPARTPGSVLTQLSDAIAEDIAEARYVKHVEAVAQWSAAEAAEAQRRWIEAERAEEVRRAEEAWRAGEARAEAARRAEAQRASAAAATSAQAGSLEAIIQRHFGSAAPAAIRIAQCESSMNPNARSATNDHGLFQINAVHRGQFEAVTGAPWSSVYDPELNTIYARHLYGQQGWGPWTCA